MLLMLNLIDSLKFSKSITLILPLSLCVKGCSVAYRPTTGTSTYKQMYNIYDILKYE